MVESVKSHKSKWEVKAFLFLLFIMLCDTTINFKLETIITSEVNLQTRFISSERQLFLGIPRLKLHMARVIMLKT